jgi:hypothetical protein
MDRTTTRRRNNSAGKNIVDLVHGRDNMSNGALLVQGEEKSGALEHLVITAMNE